MKLKRKRTLLLLLKIFLLLILILVAVNLFFIMAPQFGRKPSRDRLNALAIHSNYSKGRFSNTEETVVMQPKSYGKVIREQFRKNPARMPSGILPSHKPAFGKDSITNQFSLIWLGHSMVLMRIDGITLLTDPVFGKRASPVSFIGPRPFEVTNPFSIDDIPLPDVVLISHDHFDHLDYQTIKSIHLKIKHFIVPLGVSDHLIKWGVSPDKISETDWWEQTEYSGIQFTCTPARHFSGRRKQDNSTLWCSWVIQKQDKRVFYCGDSGYGNHFKEIGEKFGPFNITLMESGAYGKFWPQIHMMPEESVQAHIDLKGGVLLPIHWGKYNLAFHAWNEPIKRLAHKAEELEIKVATPRIGELVVPDASILDDPWWQGFSH